MANNQNRRSDSASFASILGVTLGVISGGTLFAAWRDNLIINAIKSTPYTKVSDLPMKVKTSSGPVYVKIVGRSGADETIKTENSRKDACIYEQVTSGVWYSLFSKEDNPNNQWVQEKIRREADWYVHDGTGGKAYVKAFNSENPTLQEVHTQEKPGGNFFLSMLLGGLSIKYPYKYVVKEFVFPPNKDVLILGNASRIPADGPIRITEPWEGIRSLFVPHQPAIITTKSEEEYVTDLRKSSRTKVIVGSVLGALGMFSLVGGLLKL